jgi:uncharacterized protein
MSATADAIARDPSTATYLGYARRGRNALWRYLLAPVLGLVFTVLLIAALTIGFTVLRLVPADLQQELTHPSDPLVFFIGTGLSFGAFLVGLLAAIALVHKKSPVDLIGRWRWGVFAAGGGVWLAILALATAADVAILPSGFRFSGTSATTLLAICAVCALPIQTFAEEVIFRGYLSQGLLLATRRPALAAVLAGAMFGALHIPNGIPQAVGATGFGIATSLIAIRLGGIAFTLGLHLVNNLFGAVIVVSSGDVFAGAPGLFTQTTPRLTWWDVVFEFIALAFVVWLVLRRRPAISPKGEERVDDWPRWLMARSPPPLGEGDREAVEGEVAARRSGRFSALQLPPARPSAVLPPEGEESVKG